MNDEKILKFFSRRLFLFFSFKIFLFCVLISRLFYLQVIKRKHFSEKSNNNFLKIISVPSKRGSIFDSNQRLLAGSIKVYILTIDLSKIDNIKRFFSKYEKTFELSNEEKDFLEKSYINFINPSEKIIHSNKKKIIELKTLSFEKILVAQYNFEKFDSIFFSTKYYRIYPREDSVSHIIGYLDNDIKNHKIKNFSENLNFQNGVCGLEKKFNERLSGKPKILELTIDAFGKKNDEKIIENGIEGEDIFSSINSDLQEMILNFFKDAGDKTGTVCVSEFDEQTSLTKIRACVSAPSFNQNFFNELGIKNSSEWEKIKNDKNRPLINKAIGGIYPAGSIFKVFIALAALEQKIINKDSKIFCDGGHMVGNRRYSCLGNHGSISVSDAIKFSCNSFFYALSKKMNIESLFEFGNLLGMGKISNLELSGEKIGILPSESWKKKRFNDLWRIGDSANLMIGQGYVALTPLQFNRMMSSIAFGSETNFSLLENDDSQNIIKKPICSEENLKIIRLAMFRSVNEQGGTSFNSIGAKFPELKICGKTGTALGSSAGKTLVSTIQPL